MTSKSTRCIADMRSSCTLSLCCQKARHLQATITFEAVSVLKQDTFEPGGKNLGNGDCKDKFQC
jgi:hypothetical protein